MKFLVSLHVDGIIQIPVEADSPEQAGEIALAYVPEDFVELDGAWPAYMESPDAKVAHAAE